MAQVVLENIIKKYKGVEAVRGINIQIKHGEFVVLVGPSGCGKSTTLRMIAGLEEITGGTVYIGDRVVNDLPPRDRNVSMVFQNYALYPHMNVCENLGFGLKIAKFKQQEIDKRVDNAAQILGLDDYMERLPSELSGGQRQRVAMGRAIVRDPEVFLFDEPLSNLDAKLRVQMRTEIKKLHHRLQNTIVYVTHDQVEAMTLADRIVIMRDGFIEQVGTPLEVFDKPINTFVASFVGSPPMNQILGMVTKKNIQLSDTISIPVPLRMESKLVDNQKVIIGIRPDNITLKGHGMSGVGKTAEIVLSPSIAEPLGTETILFAKIGDLEIQAKMFNPEVIDLDKSHTFSVALDKVHVFDAENGKNIMFQESS